MKTFAKLMDYFALAGFLFFPLRIIGYWVGLASKPEFALVAVFVLSLCLCLSFLTQIFELHKSR